MGDECWASAGTQDTSDRATHSHHLTAGINLTQRKPARTDPCRPGLGWHTVLALGHTNKV